MGLLGSTTPITNTDIKNTDKVYLSKSGDGDIIKYSCSMKDFKDFLVKNVYKYDYEKYYTGTTPNIQRKLGFGDTDASQEFWDALANSVSSGQNKIGLGDIVYMPITWNGATVDLWQVIDVDRYYDHDLIFRPCYINSFGMNQHYPQKFIGNGWEKSTIREIFNGENRPDPIKNNVLGLNQTIDNACYGHLKMITRQLLDTIRQTLMPIEDYVFIPTSKELIGDSNYQYPDEGGKQFKLFALNMTKAVSNLDGRRFKQWTCSFLSNYNDASFAIMIYHDPIQIQKEASYQHYYFMPCWCFSY